MRTLLILFFSSTLLLSQQTENYSFRNLTVKNGLSQNSIQTIFQDKKGYIWIGTTAGLNRYDAYTFLEFKKEGVF